MERSAEISHAFITTQLGGGKERFTPVQPRPCGPAITISHQTGSGSHEIAERLAAIFQSAEAEGARPWTIWDRQLVEKTLEEHHLPTTMAKRMPEDKRTYIDEVMDELFGLRPPSWVVVPKIIETIRHLVESGNVILIGRGATVVASQMPNVFHVRLIASLASRIDRVQRRHNLTAEEAAKLVEKEDRGRERYVKANFHTRLDDALLYHLVVNTDRIPCVDAALLIAEGARRSFTSRSAGVK